MIVLSKRCWGGRVASAEPHANHLHFAPDSFYKPDVIPVTKSSALWHYNRPNCKLICGGFYFSLLQDSKVTPASTSVNVAAVESVAPVDTVVTPASTSVNVAADVDSVVADSLANSATPLRSLIVITKRVRLLQSKREVAHAKIITSSPYKRKLENAAEEKQKKADAKRKRSEKAAEKKAKKAESKTKPAEPKIKQSEKSAESKVKKTETKRKQTQKSAAGIKKNKNRSKSDKVNVEDDEANCLYCNELYSTSSEAWIKCQGPCQKWSHLSCAGLTATDKHFVCEICQEL